MSVAPGRLVLLGHPVQHSLSPRMHGVALRALGLDVRYDALDLLPHELEPCLHALAAAGAGGNVTRPYKQRVAALCAQRSALAERTGAVNTFWVQDGQLVGDNTDVDGFAEAVLELIGAPPDGPVVVLGAGGGAAAVLAAAERWELPLRVVARTAERAAPLVRTFGASAHAIERAHAAVRDAALVVNATPVGLADDVHPLDLHAVSPAAAIVDLVYRAGETSWVRAARAQGHAAADGRSMLLAQGALALERWFGVPAPRAVMRRALAG